MAEKLFNRKWYMTLRLDPISLTALILLAILLGFVTFDHVKPEKPKEMILKTSSTLGRITYWACLGDTPEEWACRKLSRDHPIYKRGVQ